MKMGRAGLYALLVGATALLGAARAEDDAPRTEFAAFRESQAAGKVVVIDVRNADGYRAGHIPGALSVPLDKLGENAEQLKRLAKPIVAYCG